MTRLEAIRLARMTLAEGRFNNPGAERRFNDARADRAYEAAFREANLGTPDDDPAGVGARVAASAVRAPVVAALDDWAACAADGRRRAWVLGVARRADPDAWRDRARDPAAWEDPAALAGLARTAPVTDQPLSLLVALGSGCRPRRRRDRVPGPRPAGGPGRLLGEPRPGQRRRERRDAGAAVDCYLQASKARKDSAAAYNNLGLAWYVRYDLPAAIECFHSRPSDRPQVRPGVQQPRSHPLGQGVAPRCDPPVPGGR